MSINKLSHLKEGDKIYLEVGKVTTKYDDGYSMCFETNCINNVWVNDDDIFFFPDDLKKLTNDGMPKQGDEIDVRHNDGDYISGQKFVCLYEGRVIIERAGGLYRYDEWRYPPKKTELTLAEVEEKLGLEKGSLIIKD